MSQTRIAYLPLVTDPEAIPDESILAATSFAGSLDCDLHVTTFAVDIPDVSSTLGGLVVDIRGLARAAEERSRPKATDCNG